MKMIQDRSGEKAPGMITKGCGKVSSGSERTRQSEVLGGDGTLERG